MLLENKSFLIHVTCEVVVLSVLIFWVSRKTNNLWEQIDDLSQRLEDQEEKIDNHERIIKQLIDTLNKTRIQPTYKQHKNTVTKSKVIINNDVNDDDDVNDQEETESQMDEALREELAELSDLGSNTMEPKKNEISVNLQE